MKTLVIDIGGTHVKLLATGRRHPLSLDSGPNLTPKKMVADVLWYMAEWKFENVSIGYPGPVIKGQPAQEAHNVGPGWVRFHFQRAFGRPVKLINDAAMQAMGSYEGDVCSFSDWGMASARL